MKRASCVVLVSALLAGSFTPASSQVSLAVRGGLNVSNLSVTENGQAPEIPYDSRTGLFVGATLGLELTPSLVLHVGGRYSQEGTKQEEGPLTGLLRVSYVDVPLFVKAYVAEEGSQVRPYLMAGGFVGFEAGCDVRMEGAVGVELSCDAAEAQRETTDLGAIVGAGTDVAVGRVTLTLDAEYSWGLRNIALEAGTEARSRVLSVGLGFAVSL